MAEGDIGRFLDPAVLARLSAQRLLARLPMEGNISGHHRSPHRGSSVEFAEYRVYSPGDDIRRLDWRVFGRTDRFYIKEFEADTNLRCQLVLDTSGSMGFGSGMSTKLEFAKRMAATLAYLLIKQGDAVGLDILGNGLDRHLPARRNPSHLQLIGGLLEGASASGATGLAASLHDLAEEIRQRALIVVFSDLFGDEESLISAFQHLRFKKHDLVVFQLLDRHEVDFPFSQPVRFEDMESSFNLVCEPGLIRDEYLSQLGSFLNNVKAACHRLNADYHQLMTDEGFESVLGPFLVSRAQAGVSGR